MTISARFKSQPSQKLVSTNTATSGIDSARYSVPLEFESTRAKVKPQRRIKHDFSWYQTLSQNPRKSSESCYEKRYVPSTWEQQWNQEISTLADETTHWSVKGGCAKMRDASSLISQWLLWWETRNDWTADGMMKESWPTEVFSFHEITNVCDTEAPVVKIPIEPLVGILRHPRHICFSPSPFYDEVTRSFELDKNYMLPLWNFEVLPAPTTNFFFDLGASLYSAGLGGASQSWFIDTYKTRGIIFDRILAWEAEPYTPIEIFEGMPPEILDRMSYYNLAADAEIGAKFNPLRTIRALCKPSDFVVLKIDIDHTQVEEELVRELATNPELAELVDEFYFEHHVVKSPLMHTWQDYTGAFGKSASIEHSYKLFSALRQQGVRAHPWV